MIFIPVGAFLSCYQVFPPNHVLTFRQTGYTAGKVPAHR
jgi:hypothetical protein